MILNFKIVQVDSKYCDYLRKFDNKVTFNSFEKETVTIFETKYQKLLKEQLSWLNANYMQVKNKSSKLYILYNN